ncbi:gluconate kinase (FGGY family) [Thermoflavifilum aggregans]|uniref:Gluconate kinase (FGGY family) n=1 Tax=Thermoflavifilum aggregans TaxID=454188 RepID=A0A2M9CSE3_9BACT|nr:gluconokinase [Thermoflavifilum aggregans]PJJ74860.1 gluconate kinase (FGGY family) [Thermoflavifilum aggregans]
MQTYWLALDIGTSSVKIACCDTQGRVLHTAAKPSVTFQPRPGWEEQEPDSVLLAVGALLAEAVARLGQPQAISFSAAMHSLMAMDREGKALSPLLIWSDLRSSEEARWLKKELGESVYIRSGVPVHPMLPLCKLLYWKNQASAAWFEQVHVFCSIKEYLIYHLTGQLKTDYAMAGATGMFNMLQLDWNDDLLRAIRIDRHQLPEIVSPLTALSTTPNFYLTKTTGLIPGIPVLVGATDGCLAAWGSGLANTRHISLTVGTSAAVRRWSNRPVWDQAQRLFCYLLFPDSYIAGAALNNGGGIIPWFMQTMDGQTSDPDRWIESALEAPPGSAGLMCLPYLYGERSPVWDPDASAAFFGLRAHHRTAHFRRAILEGIGFTLMQCLNILESVMGPSDAVFLSGGITRSIFWMQLLADMLGRRLRVWEGLDASCAGALQLIALFFRNSTWQINQPAAPEQQKIIIPHAETATFYASLLPAFEALYPLVKSWQEKFGH